MRLRGKKWLVVGIVFVVAVLCAVLYMMVGRSSLPKTDTKVIDTVGVTPSVQDVAKLDKTEAFWAYFKNAAEQQQLTISKVEAAIAEGQNEDLARYYYSKAGIDYTTKKYVIAQEEHEAGKIAARVRCYDGDSYIPRGSNIERWTKYDSKDPVYQCRFDKRADKFNDGINTGGLSPEQAQTFVGTLRDQQGLFAVKNLELVQRNDRPYLHFTVAVTPAPGPSGVLKFGSGWLMMAFRKTELDPVKHPYAYIGGEGQGFTYEYYIDPKTKLPAYSEVILDKDEQATGKHVYKNRYQFGTATFDASTANHDPLTFDW